MGTDEDFNERLSALLALPDREPDERFVLRISNALIAEQCLAAARKAAWHKFAVEMAAAGAVVLAFLLLGRGASELPDGAAVPLYNPAMAGFLLLGLWMAVTVRPAGRPV